MNPVLSASIWHTQYSTQTLGMLGRLRVSLCFSVWDAVEEESECSEMLVWESGRMRR